MGKKGKAPKEASEALDVKPFCYYCDAEFDSTKTLIQHQKARHFCCDECGSKFETIMGLRVHMLNKYKKPLKEVPNAMSGRENPDIAVQGMEGLPNEILEERLQKAQEDRAAERERLREEDEVKARLQEEEAAASERASDRKKMVREETTAQASPSSPPPPAPPPPTATGLLTIKVSAPQNPAAAAASRQRKELQAAQEPSKPPVPLEPPPPAPPRLSDATIDLLVPAGRAAQAAEPEGQNTLVDVPSVPGVPIPKALAALHPVALKVLASAGALRPPAPAPPPAPAAPPPAPAAMAMTGPGIMAQSAPIIGNLPGGTMPPFMVPQVTPLVGPGPGPMQMGACGAPMRALGPPMAAFRLPPMGFGGEPDEKRPRLAVA